MCELCHCVKSVTPCLEINKSHTQNIHSSFLIMYLTEMISISPVISMQQSR